MKKFTAILIALGIVGVLGILSAIPKKSAESGQEANLNNTASRQKDADNMSIAVAPAQKVEVFLFHRTQRCITCITVGKLSGQTIKERFGPEVLAGKVIFREINIDEPENKSLAEKFQSSGSSLFINTIREGNDNIEEDVQVWRLTNDPQAFKDYLSGKISNLFGKQ